MKLKKKICNLITLSHFEIKFFLTFKIQLRRDAKACYLSKMSWNGNLSRFFFMNYKVLPSELELPTRLIFFGLFSLKMTFQLKTVQSFFMDTSNSKRKSTWPLLRLYLSEVVKLIQKKSDWVWGSILLGWYELVWISWDARYA